MITCPSFHYPLFLDKISKAHNKIKLQNSKLEKRACGHFITTSSILELMLGTKKARYRNGLTNFVKINLFSQCLFKLYKDPLSCLYIINSFPNSLQERLRIDQVPKISLRYYEQTAVQTKLQANRSMVQFC